MRRGSATLTSTLAPAIVAALCALLLGAGAAGELADPAWLRTSSGDITVVYRPGDRRPADRILDMALSRGPATARAVGLSSAGPLTLYVASSDTDFEVLTLGGVPDWGVGCAFPERGVIVLRSPAELPDPLKTEDIVVHEIAHVVSGRALGEIRTPTWFEEGLAMTLAGEWRLPLSPGLSGAGPSGGLIPLSQLRSAFPRETAAAMLAYVESYNAVRFLMERSGARSPAALLNAVRTSGTFESGVLELYGKSLDQFEADAVASFGKRFGWGFFLTGWNMLALFLTLLLLLSGAIRMHRTRQRFRIWEEEEERERADRTASGPPDTRWQ